jgi:hypothetical protein
VNQKNNQKKRSVFSPIADDVEICFSHSLAKVVSILLNLSWKFGGCFQDLKNLERCPNLEKSELA